jgi:hypothetical protein
MMQRGFEEPRCLLDANALKLRPLSRLPRLAAGKPLEMKELDLRCAARNEAAQRRHGSTRCTSRQMEASRSSWAFQRKRDGLRARSSRAMLFIDRSLKENRAI